ncbi:bifunctional 2-polyprenyl-6-hydroxyphenol methylase/3-demethylubiquinol 3-O-methyltransferase UbiG [Brachybacterium sp. YJGR34]|uniref:class I SAM-dependent methyltransferase n=1 Tax=Brachybacterium sp. YJGR34 TaxID=2059911 RepID=UPI000E0C5552|nr:class I SAM-dependent methyltransferase [Brachybacterium sp. YJGR34]
MTDAWNVRTTPNPLIRRAGRLLGRLNARHPWDHNAHFHGWILRSLPEQAARVLDVGCGRGALVEALAARAARVDGIDPDQGMAYASATRFRDRRRVRIRRCSLGELAEREERAGAYDAVTMIASLHHMELDRAFAEARDLLRPGGRLLVVTLARPEGAVDQIWDIANVLTNPLIGMIKHPRPVRDPAPATGAPMPVQEASWSLATLRERADLLLPGAVIRRREGFRATLRWQKPEDPGAPGGGHAGR